jgi:hypothetical protein
VKKGVRGRFYAETILTVITGIMFLVTLINRAWIETVFHLDPDQGQGWVEWTIVAVLLVAAITCAVLARSEWRRVSIAAA